MKRAQLQPGVTARILVVEDDADQRELVVEALRMYFNDPDGQHIRAVGTAAECLALDLARFEAVLLDYNLPDANGLDLLEKVLAQAELPVIFVTGENVTAKAAEAIQKGAQDYVVKLGDYLFAIPVLVQKCIHQHRVRMENRQLQAQLQATLEEVRVKNLQLEESLQKLELAASTDDLTGLSNRRYFGQMLEKYFGEALRYEFDLSCVMMDLDDYKTLNDTLGHQTGDRVLVTAAQVIRSNLRASDLAARYGGDEFVLLLPHTPVELAVAVSERIRVQLASASQQFLKLPHPLSASIGVASLKEHHPLSGDSLVAMSDRALYGSKDAGKDRIMVYAEPAPVAPGRSL